MLNKFFNPSTPSMRKGRGGGETGKKDKKKKSDGNSGHYLIASRRPPERRPLERCTLPTNHHLSSTLFWSLPWTNIDLHLHCLHNFLSKTSHTKSFCFICGFLFNSKHRYEPHQHFPKLKMASTDIVPHWHFYKIILFLP